jgi:hypothetical protein
VFFPSYLTKSEATRSPRPVFTDPLAKKKEITINQITPFVNAPNAAANVSVFVTTATVSPRNAHAPTSSGDSISPVIVDAKAVFWVRVLRGADLQGLEHIFCRVREPVGVRFWPSRSWYKLSSGYTATSRQTVQRERGNAKPQLDVRGYELRVECDVLAACGGALVDSSSCGEEAGASRQRTFEVGASRLPGSGRAEHCQFASLRGV